MIGELCEVLRREAAAVGVLEARLRAMELVVAADEQSFVAFALDECETASHELAACELTRVLALSAAGIDVDAKADELIGVISDAGGSDLRRRIDELREATVRLADVRERARAVVSRAASGTRARVEAASAFADA